MKKILLLCCIFALGCNSHYYISNPSDAGVSGDASTCSVAPMSSWSTACWTTSRVSIRGSECDYSVSVDFNLGRESAVVIPHEWPESGRETVTFQMEVETTTENVYVLPVENNDRIYNAVVFNSDGRFGNGGDSSHPFYNRNQWYTISYVIDFTTGYFSLLVDGEEIESGPFLENVGIPCESRLTLTGGLSFNGGYTDQEWSGSIRNLTFQPE